MKIQRFYRPIFYNTLDMPCIIYPARDESQLDGVLSRTEHGCIEAFVRKVLTANAAHFDKTSYLFAIVWNIEQALLLDVWKFELENKSESGPLVTAFTFRDTESATDIGTASGDGLILLGYEETLRRRHDSLESYLADQTRHEMLPEENRADEGFYI